MSPGAQLFKRKELHLQDNEHARKVKISFPYERMYTKTHFETDLTGFFGLPDYLTSQQKKWHET